jgi:hypothetical protein
LNIPAIAVALQACAFPGELAGAAHLRWSETGNRPVAIPAGTVGIIALARMAVRQESGIGWAEHKTELHIWLVPRADTPKELVGHIAGETLRSILLASVRTKPEPDEGLYPKMAAAESGLIEQYRKRTEADVEAGIRYAVFPLCAAVISD